MKSLSAGILVLNPHSELLLCHATGTVVWDIPKGGGDAGESTLATAIRETAEETGLRFAPEELLDLGHFSYRPTKDLHLYAALRERFDPRHAIAAATSPTCGAGAGRRWTPTSGSPSNACIGAARAAWRRC